MADSWDPLHNETAPGLHWTTTNVRENVPGVPTPLTWSLWRRGGEHAVRTGLVVDIGGALSHAAVVARELRLPCVVNTQTGSQTIRTGDRLRVDGAKGIVEIVERAPVAEVAP